MARFAQRVSDHYAGREIHVLDVGSTNIGGSYRDLFGFPGSKYVGVDIQPGANVDIVLSDPYDWTNLRDEAYDVVISGQALEHIEFPWLVLEQIARKLKVGGLGCLIAPSRGPEHRYPVDCYRYYPDGMRALAKWARLTVLECSYVRGASGFRDGSDEWGDCHCVVRKPEQVPSSSKVSSRKQSTAKHRSNPLELADPGYFDNERPEVIEVICAAGLRPKRILELGCAAGTMAKRLRQRLSPETYVGLEADSFAAERARAILTEVHVVDLNTAVASDLGLKDESYDLLVALDVLEHLYNPWDVLADYGRKIGRGGYLVASIPNIANVSIIRDLVAGRWRYVAAGLLDSTHLRFFTLETVQELCAGAGFQIQHIHRLLNPAPDMTSVRDLDNTLNLGNVSIPSLSKAEILNLFTQQFIVIAQKPG
jgi:2-polyprenyl-3-methyl-5-hydroxy-6-metoxy-1,4-benzoquinol methylase